MSVLSAFFPKIFSRIKLSIFAFKTTFCQHNFRHLTVDYRVL